MTSIQEIWDIYVKDVYGESTSPQNPFCNGSKSCSGYECLCCGKRIIPMTTKGKGNAAGRMRSHIEVHIRKGEMPK